MAGVRFPQLLGFVLALESCCLFAFNLCGVVSAWIKSHTIQLARFLDSLMKMVEFFLFFVHL